MGCPDFGGASLVTRYWGSIRTPPLLLCLRCMITAGPRPFESTAAAPMPDAFSCDPNVIRFLGILTLFASHQSQLDVSICERQQLHDCHFDFKTSEPSIRELGVVWHSRLVGPNRDDRELVANYVERAKHSLICQAAAQAWAQGVPWAQALTVATRAFAAGDAVDKAPLSRRKGKGKGKGKAAKGKA